MLGCDVLNHLAELSCGLFQQDCALGYVYVSNLFSVGIGGFTGGVDGQGGLYKQVYSNG